MEDYNSLWSFVAERENRRSLHSATPDFLFRLVVLVHFMRLSLRKGAHAAMSSAAWQEIRVRSGRDDKGGVAPRYSFVADRKNCRSLGYAPPDFLWSLAALADLMRLSLRERRMKCTNA